MTARHLYLRPVSQIVMIPGSRLPGEPARAIVLDPHEGGTEALPRWTLDPRAFCAPASPRDRPAFEGGARMHSQPFVISRSRNGTIKFRVTRSKREDGAIRAAIRRPIATRSISQEHSLHSQDEASASP